MPLLGSAFLFVPLLAATMIVGGCVFAYAAHCFLTVVEQTAAGNDEVTWPDEPYQDWLWKAVYLLWLSALWLGPVAFLAKSGLASAAAGGGAGLVTTAAVLVWLLFPITLLSSMSASSRWVLLSPRLVARLLSQRLGSLLGFYFSSGPVLAAAAVLFYLTAYAPGGLVLVIVTALGFAATFLLYARLLGRLAHLTSFADDPGLRREQPAARPRPRARARAEDDPAAPNRSPQPSELPPVMTPFEGPVTGYDVSYDDPPPAPEPPPRRRPPDLDDVPYDLQEPADVAPPRGPRPAVYTRPPEYELALARGGTRPPPPKHPWADGTVGFLGYSQTVPHLATLAVGFGAMGACVYMLRAFWPL